MELSVGRKVKFHSYIKLNKKCRKSIRGFNVCERRWSMLKFIDLFQKYLICLNYKESHYVSFTQSVHAVTVILISKSKSDETMDKVYISMQMKQY